MLDFPGELTTTYEYPIPDWERTGVKVAYLDEEPTYTPIENNLSKQILPNGDEKHCGYITKTWFFHEGKWQEITEVKNESSMTELYKYYYISSINSIIGCMLYNYLLLSLKL